MSSYQAYWYCLHFFTCFPATHPQMNQVSQWLDLSQVYNSKMSNYLRYQRDPQRPALLK